MSRPKISTPADHAEALAVFKYYAGAYARMERLQRPKTKVEEPERLLPTGDQKTGCIGEYWAVRYARARFGKDACSFGHHSQQGWDIAIKGSTTRIQVKTVSAWSKSRTLSPVHHPEQKPSTAPSDWAPWTDLWLIYLNARLTPTGFWKLGCEDVEFESRSKLSGLKIQKPANPKTGSKRFKWPANTIRELLEAKPHPRSTAPAILPLITDH